MASAAPSWRLIAAAVGTAAAVAIVAALVGYGVGTGVVGLQSNSTGLLLVALFGLALGGLGLGSVLLAREIRRAHLIIRKARIEARTARAQQILLRNSEGVGLVEVDVEEQLITLSRSAGRLLGVAPGQHTWADALAHVVDTDGFERAFVSAAAAGGPDKVSLRMSIDRGEDGLVKVHVGGRVLRHRTGDAMRVVALLRDVSGREGPPSKTKLKFEVVTDDLRHKMAERTAEAEKRADQARRLAFEVTAVERRANQRLATVLHDGLQQTLVAIRLSLALLITDKESRADIDGLVKEAIETTRTLSAQLHPPVVPEHGLGPSLEWLANQARDRHGLEVTLSGDGMYESLPEQEAIALFEAARELLFNVVKHAGVSEAHINVSVRGGARWVTVRDHGHGFSPGSKPTGMGLAHHELRLAALGGGLHLRSGRSRGCVATAWLPADGVPDLGQLYVDPVPTPQDLR